MEAFLNLFWALIALAALGAWRACWIRERRAGRRDPVRECAAVVCALVLLFFAVSLSDDLHTSPALLEESSGTRRHSSLREVRHPAPNLLQLASAHPIGTRSAPVLAQPLSNFIQLGVPDKESVSSFEAAAPLGRAPPSHL